MAWHEVFWSWGHSEPLCRICAETIDIEDPGNPVLDDGGAGLPEFGYCCPRCGRQWVMCPENDVGGVWRRRGVMDMMKEAVDAVAGEE